MYNLRDFHNNDIEYNSKTTSAKP